MLSVCILNNKKDLSCQNRQDVGSYLYANRYLAREVSELLDISLGNCTVTKFSDGEAHIEILENVRGLDVSSFNEPVLEQMIT